MDEDTLRKVLTSDRTDYDIEAALNVEERGHQVVMQLAANPHKAQIGSRCLKPMTSRKEQPSDSTPPSPSPERMLRSGGFDTISFD
jgi:hypothetical protein